MDLEMGLEYRMIDEITRENAVNDVKNGMSYLQAAKKHGVDDTSVERWCRAVGVQSLHMKLDVTEPEHLESLYYGNGYSLREIGNIFGCSLDTIRDRMIEYGIPCRIAGGHKQFIIEPELLWCLYWGNGYSTLGIANIFGCGRHTIGKRMKEYSIPRRSIGNILTDFTFNDRQREIFEGCMLGDGGLQWETNNCSFANGDNHNEYLFWLQKQLGVEHISKVFPDRNCNRLITKVIPSIREEHKRWYPYKTRKGTMQNRNNKVVPKDIELTPIKMLFWYIGDGCYSKARKCAYFTNCLDLDDWVVLSRKIYKVLGVDNGISISKGGNDSMGNQKYRLRLNRVVTNKFFDMVDSLGFDVPECYQYKFGV